MWENIIEDSITNIPSTYGENELAFLAIQSKIELQLRDKIAWYIEKKLKAGQYIEQNINARQYCVRREYNVPGKGKGREKCDLAILDIDNNMKPVCLIEFKAHSAATFEKGYIKMCNHDIAKMRRIASSTEPKPEIYYIFFQTEHQGTLPVNNGLIAYYNIIKKALNQKLGITHIHNQWDPYYKNGKNYSNGIITKLQIPAGRYYGLRIVIHAMMLKVDFESITCLK